MSTLPSGSLVKAIWPAAGRPPLGAVESEPQAASASPRTVANHQTLDTLRCMSPPVSWFASLIQQPVAGDAAIGVAAKGRNAGVGPPASTTTASPLPGPAPDGPLADPHQLQVASMGVVMFGPTRS